MLNADNLEVFCIIFATELNHICHTHLALGYIFLLQSYILVKASDQNNNMVHLTDVKIRNSDLILDLIRPMITSISEQSIFV